MRARRGARRGARLAPLCGPTVLLGRVERAMPVQEGAIREILYVEDDDTVRGLYAEYLREAGFRVREARLAEEDFKAARCAPPDLVILDLAMPPGEMSGTEVLARLREDQAMAEIPIVLFSGLGNIVNPDLITSLRVAAVVTKPARAHHLLETVSRILRSRP